MNLTYRICTFTELTKHELYAILKFRQEIFVVEQNCPYLDCDDKDQTALHLFGLQQEAKTPVAYLRILPPQGPEDAVYIGRVVCHPALRGAGLGKELMKRGLTSCSELFPGHIINISAQLYLTDFYTNFGFSVSSKPYDEDGIDHIEMTYTPRPFVKV